MRAIPVLLAFVLLAPQAALATLTFSRLDDDVFSVSHRVKLIGSRGKATETAPPVTPAPSNRQRVWTVARQRLWVRTR